MKPLKVSEVARRAGVSVRTLHYYEEIGLLKPSRTPSGHRRYDEETLARLQQIRSLQCLGLSLSQVDELFRGRSVAAAQVVTSHLAAVQQQRRALKRLESKLKRLYRLIQGERADDLEAIEVLLNTLEAMAMYEKHFGAEQLDQINALHDNAGADVSTNWQAALDALRAEMQAGTDPAAPPVKAIVARWHDAAKAFMPANDEKTHAAVMELLHREPKARQDHGLDDELFAYLGRALAPDEHKQS